MLLLSSPAALRLPQPRARRRTRIHRQGDGRAGEAGRAPAPTTMAQQVTDRIERKLQEVAEIDYTEQLLQAGRHRRSRSPCARRLPASKVPDVWYQVRKKIGDIQHARCRRACRARCSTTSSATPSATCTRSPATASRYAELRKFVDQARDEFLRVPDVSKVQYIGVQDEKIFVETSSAKLASLGIDPQLDRGHAARRPTPWCRPAPCRPAPARGAARSPASSIRSRPSQTSASDAGDRTLPPGRHRARVSRLRRSGRQPRCTSTARRPSAWPSRMREGGDVIRMGQRPRRRGRARAGGPAGGRGDPCGLQPAEGGAGIGARVHQEPGRSGRSSCWR